MNHNEASVWRIFSLFIRMRDSDWRGYVKCISCNKIDNFRVFHCGHYISRGSDSALKFNEINNNAQCAGCNLFKSGNLINYRQGLVEKYDEKTVVALEQSHWFKTTKKKLNQLELNGVYDFYKKKIKDLEENRNKLTPYHVRP